jgi:hypothetical protein
MRAAQSNGKSKALHFRIVTAPLVFLVIGPVLPILYLAISGTKLAPLLLFGVMLGGAWFLGGLPALLAGALYSCFSYFLAKLTRVQELNLFVSFILGAVASAISMLFFSKRHRRRHITDEERSLGADGTWNLGWNSVCWLGKRAHRMAVR